MKRPCKSVPFAVLLALSVAGCGGEIARIDGLPDTRDVADMPWPRLVDTPVPPADTLLPAEGQRAFTILDETRQTVLARAEQPGPQRVALAELGGRVARIRQQATVTAPGVDQADLAARAARLSQGRAVPVVAVPEAELQARARRIAAARMQTRTGVDEAELRTRAQRIAAARAQGPGGLDSASLAARATRVNAGSQTYYSSLVDRDDLTRRSQRIGAITNSPSDAAPADLRALRGQAPAPPPPATPTELAVKRDSVVARRTTPVPEPVRKPAAKRPDRSEPVISDSFRKRAEEARRRARERAKAAKTE